MDVKRLTPNQIAVDMTDKEFRDRLDKMLSPELKAEGFTVDSVERGYDGNDDKVWLIMLKKKLPQGQSTGRILSVQAYKKMCKKAADKMASVLYEAINFAGGREPSGQKPEDAGSSPAPATNKGV